MLAARARAPAPGDRLSSPSVVLWHGCSGALRPTCSPFSITKPLSCWAHERVAASASRGVPLGQLATGADPLPSLGAGASSAFPPWHLAFRGPCSLPVPQAHPKTHGAAASPSAGRGELQQGALGGCRGLCGPQLCTADGEAATRTCPHLAVCVPSVTCMSPARCAQRHSTASPWGTRWHGSAPEMRCAGKAVPGRELLLQGLLRLSQAGFAGRAVSSGALGASLCPQPCSLPQCPGGACMVHVHPPPRATWSQSVSGRAESLRQWISQLKADFLGSEDISAFIQGHPFSIKSRHGLNKWAAEIKGFFFSFFFLNH